MGDDLRIVNAARVSFDKESSFLCAGDPFELDINTENPKHVEYITYLLDKKPEFGDLIGGPDGVKLNYKDYRLLKYLAEHNHWTPFSHPQITLKEDVPIFVARQRFKHMVGFSYNEVSRRYVNDTPEFFMPSVWRSKPEGSIKQGSGDPHPTWNRGVGTGYIDRIVEMYDSILDLYETMIEDGVAPEQARMILPQSMITSYYVTGSLAAFARAYKQRADSHAQSEIQDLAKQWDAIIRPLFPASWSALVD